MDNPVSSTPPPTPRVVEKVSRLAAPQRRRLKQLLQEAELAGSRVTVPGLRERIAVEFGLAVTAAVAEKLLTEFGYRITDELDPVLAPESGMDAVRVWVMEDRARPLSPMEKAQALSARLDLLSNAFVEDLMDDELLRFGSLDDIAIEATRAFSLALADAVKGRAKFGARALLPRCGETAHLTFKGALTSG